MPQPSTRAKILATLRAGPAYASDLRHIATGSAVRSAISRLRADGWTILTEARAQGTRYELAQPEGASQPEPKETSQ